jgi:hypothetical protein
VVIVRPLRSWSTSAGGRASGVFTLDDPLEHETLVVVVSGSLLHRGTQRVINAGHAIRFAPGEVMDLIALEDTQDWTIEFAATADPDEAP